MQYQQHLQINVGHLKTEIVKKLGTERSKQYFFYLNRFLSLKITKVEFNKICFRILGRENIVLHNQLITSILRNAYHAKVPPEIRGTEVSKPLDAAGESVDYNFLAPSDELQQGSACKDQVRTSNSSLLSNGSILHPPCKTRSANHERTKGADPSFVPVFENGSASLGTISGNRGKAVLLDDQSRVFSDTKMVSTEDWKGSSTRSLLQAPLGIPLCAASTGGARRALALKSSGGCSNSYDYGGLFDSVTLKHCMEQIAMNEGLQGVSLDSANLLNNALDSYLKNLIKSSIGMTGKGSVSDAHSNMTYKIPLHSSSRPMDGALQDQRPANKVSLLDFRVAMELKPQQLGEDWPLLLEKTCVHSHKD